MSKNVNAKLKIEYESESDYLQSNPILFEHELIVVMDANGNLRCKVGDGVTHYADLPYIGGSTGGSVNIPIRGVDYWTEKDIAQIHAYVDDAILGGEW